MFFSEWYNKQCIHKNWQSYTQINRGTICAKELPFRVQPFRGVNCGLIPCVFRTSFSENIGFNDLMLVLPYVCELRAG